MTTKTKQEIELYNSLNADGYYDLFSLRKDMFETINAELEAGYIIHMSDNVGEQGHMISRYCFNTKDARDEREYYSKK